MGRFKPTPLPYDDASERSLHVRSLRERAGLTVNEADFILAHWDREPDAGLPARWLKGVPARPDEGPWSLLPAHLYGSCAHMEDPKEEKAPEDFDAVEAAWRVILGQEAAYRAEISKRLEELDSALPAGAPLPVTFERCDCECQPELYDVSLVLFLRDEWDGDRPMSFTFVGDDDPWKGLAFYRRRALQLTCSEAAAHLNQRTAGAEWSAEDVRAFERAGDVPVPQDYSSALAELYDDEMSLAITTFDEMIADADGNVQEGGRYPLWVRPDGLLWDDWCVPSMERLGFRLALDELNARGASGHWVSRGWTARPTGHVPGGVGFGDPDPFEALCYFLPDGSMPQAD